MGTPRTVRVLIVGDTASTCRLLRAGLAVDAGLRVVGEAADARLAHELLHRERPDVVVLEPELDGAVELLRGYMDASPTPTVLVSAQPHGANARAARAHGGVDVLARPRPGRDGALQRQLRLIGARVKAAAGVAPDEAFDAPQLGAHSVVAIGSSTGGIEALTRILPAFGAQSPPLVIVQHIPAGFSASLAQRLDSLGRLRVREAVDGDALQPGLALLAPGGVRHMVVERVGAQLRVRLLDGAPVNYSRPSVDVLFESVARHVGAHAGAALLTGMGRDGASGMLEIRRRGGHTVAQDEATSVVFGMPQMAQRLGAAEAVAPLPEIPSTLARLMRGAAKALRPHAFKEDQPWL
jgi:two-component system chemotaxis response regulator CheB